MNGKKKNDESLFGKRSLRSYVREAGGALSELPIFENRFYDLFRTPLDTFQEHFPKGGGHGWRTKDDEYVEATNETLYELWRKAGAPSIEERPYDRSMTAPREFAFSDDPNKAQMTLGYLFGNPRLIVGTANPRNIFGAGGDVLTAELAHQIMFENPQKYGSKKEQIKEMTEAGYRTRKEKGMTVKEELEEYYDKPGTSEHTAHSIVEPKIIEWLKGL